MGGWIVTICDRQGVKLDEVDAKVTDCDWLLSTYGKATIEIATTNPKNRRRLFEFGNRVLIETNADDANGVDLPAWGGVIDPPRAWSGANNFVTTITCYTPDWLLYSSPGPLPALKQQWTYGDIFRWIIQQSNQPEDKFLREGDIDTNGADSGRTADGETMYDVLQNLVKDSGYEYVFEPGWDSGGKLVFNCHFRERFGGDSIYPLIEGHNVSRVSPALTEDGLIYNVITAYWSGGVEINPNLIVTVLDQDSINRFGRREKLLAVSSNYATLSSVEQAARAELKKTAWTKATPQLAVLKAEAIKEMRLGWNYPCRFTTAGYYGDSELGWEGTARVIGMNYNGQVLTLNIEGDEA